MPSHIPPAGSPSNQGVLGPAAKALLPDPGLAGGASEPRPASCPCAPSTPPSQRLGLSAGLHPPLGECGISLCPRRPQVCEGPCWAAVSRPQDGRGPLSRQSGGSQAGGGVSARGACGSALRESRYHTCGPKCDHELTRGGDKGTAKTPALRSGLSPSLTLSLSPEGDQEVTGKHQDSAKYKPRSWAPGWQGPGGSQESARGLGLGGLGTYSPSIWRPQPKRKVLAGQVPWALRGGPSLNTPPAARGSQPLLDERRPLSASP